MELPEHIWGAILSREKKQVIRVFSLLDKTEQSWVIEHLKHMSQDEGWHPEQVKSAKIALKVLLL